MRVYPLAIILGFLTDILLTRLFGQIEFTLVGVTSESPYFLNWAILFGTIGTSIGAYITAKHSPSDRYLNLMLFAALEIIYGALVPILYSFPLPVWFTIVSSILIVLSSLFVGWLVGCASSKQSNYS